MTHQSVRQSAEGSHGIGWRARLVPVWPIVLVVLMVLAVDRLLWWAMDPTLSWPEVDAQVAGLAPDRPVLAVIGSSRSYMGLPRELLAKELAARGLPHQEVNLSITGGGTPSLALAILADHTRLLRSLPPGSKVVYVFSPFEMNFLQRRRMLSLPTGAEMMSRFGMVDADGWAFRLRDISGFARLALNDAWMDWPYPFNRIMEASIQPMLLKDATHGCNAAGLANYQLLPVNRWAMERLAETLGPDLIVVFPPLSDRQQAVDRDAGILPVAMPWLDSYAQAHGLRFDPGFGDRLNLPREAFATDCDHLHRSEDKEVFAKAVVDLLR
ncbi:MAG TPA: hypothetical protein VL974_04490 [Magnetospirillum sp.]|jgi:hypothetical protein|nr:hypothetical protein [Magnetospirillum sp.]